MRTPDRGASAWEKDHRIAASTDDFDRCFIAQLAHFHGFDPAGPWPARNTLRIDARRTTHYRLGASLVPPLVADQHAQRCFTHWYRARAAPPKRA